MPEVADIKDALRAAYWRIRCFVLWCWYRLTGKAAFIAFQVDPHSPGWLFNQVLASVSEIAGGDAPTCVVVTPQNILDYTVHPMDPTIVTSAQTDAVEAWRRLRKSLRQMADQRPCVVSSGHPYELLVDVTADSLDRVCFNLKRGPAIQHPEHVEAELGIQPDEPVDLTAEQLTRLLGCTRAHSQNPTRP